MTLPCAHDHWYKKGEYHDPNAYRTPTKKKWDDLIAAIREQKLVILTKDKVIDELSSFDRTGYIGIFEVENVTVTGNDLRYQFVKRVANLQ